MTTLRTPGLLLFSLLLPLASHGGTILLKSGERIEGEVSAFGEGIWTISAGVGPLRKIPQGEIAAIEFEKPTQPAEKNFLSALPKSASKFQTPTQTFQTWKRAAAAGEIDGMVECYAAYRKDVVRAELKKLTRAQREQMRKTTAATEFTTAEPLYQGDRAALDVTWRIGVASDNQVLQFSLEGNDWKIIE